MSQPQFRPPRLEGKVAIATGAGSSGSWHGTGKAPSILFAREGARVVLVDRDAAAAADTARILREEGGDPAQVIADGSSAADCRRAVDHALERFGRLDVLVNNVGIVRAPPGFGRSVVDVDEAAWDRILAVNLTSAMLMSKHAVPAMAAAGGGSIVHVSSTAALRGMGHVAYAASKGGLISLTRDMAVWHGRERIRVNCIAPGSLFTPLAAAQQDDLVAFRPAHRDRSARHRGQCLGLRLRRALPGERRGALDHRRGPAGRRRPAGDHGADPAPAARGLGARSRARWRGRASWVGREPRRST